VPSHQLGARIQGNEPPPPTNLF